MSTVKHDHLPMPEIHSVSRMLFTRRYSEEYHDATHDELIYVISGGVRVHFKNGKEYSAGKNELLFIPAGTNHKDIFEMKTGLEVFFIQFKWKWSEKFFASAVPDCTKDLSSKDRNEITLLLDMFRLDLYQCQEDFTVAEGRLAHLFALVWRHVFIPAQKQAQGNDAYLRLANYAFCYMAAHLSEPITPDSAAAYLKVSRSTLTRALRYAGSMSFNDRLRSMRMNEAYTLLLEHGISASECALRCGYQDPAYFSRVFKKHFGFSPKNLK